jgi:transposase
MLIPEVTKLQQLYPSNKFALQMDNVAYHKSQTTKDLLQQANILPLFQPPYSPDLNKIEPSWLHLKLGIISQCYQQIAFEDKLCDYLSDNSW